jgi:Flp pilus assembly protein TadG
VNGRSERESGSALVEFAIVLLPLCIILFGIITYGVDLCSSNR